MKDKDQSNIVYIDEDWVNEVVDTLQDQLELPYLDLDQKDTLQQLVILSVSMYFMYVRESMTGTTTLKQ